MCNDDRDCKCISDILKVISLLQKRTEIREDEQEEENTCDKPTLGCCHWVRCNTRPVQLFLCGGNGDDPLVMPINKGPITPNTIFSSVFRVEKVDDCCCTCRVLRVENTTDELDEETSKCYKYAATNSFFTLDLRCCCAVKCLDDTYVECL